MNFLLTRFFDEERSKIYMQQLWLVDLIIFKSIFFLFFYFEPLSFDFKILEILILKISEMQMLKTFRKLKSLSERLYIKAADIFQSFENNDPPLVGS